MATAPLDDQLVADLIAAEAYSTEASRSKARKAAWATFKGRGFPAAPPAPTPTPVPVPAPVNTVDRVVYCTKSPHEAAPHGVPTSYDWQAGPTVQRATPGSDQCAIVWGQVYLAVNATLPVNTRVELRDMRLYAFTGSAWTLIQKSDAVAGGAYPESFIGDNVPPDTRVEADGALSVKLQAGYNFHFWINQWPRPNVPSTATALYSTVQARLVPHDSTKPADVSPRLVVNVGADWYETPLSAAGASVQPGAGQGRFCVVTPQWQAFDFCTLGETQVRATPPPL